MIFILADTTQIEFVKDKQTKEPFPTDMKVHWEIYLKGNTNTRCSLMHSIVTRPQALLPRTKFTSTPA